MNPLVKIFHPYRQCHPLNIYNHSKGGKNMLELKPVPLDEKAYALLKNLGTTHEGKTIVFPTTLIYCNEALEALYVESTKNLRELHEELLEEMWIKEATSLVIIPCQTMIDADFYKLVCVLQFKPKYQKLNEYYLKR